MYVGKQIHGIEGRLSFHSLMVPCDQTNEKGRSSSWKVRIYLLCSTSVLGGKWGEVSVLGGSMGEVLGANDSHFSFLVGLASIGGHACVLHPSLPNLSSVAAPNRARPRAAHRAPLSGGGERPEARRSPSCPNHARPTRGPEPEPPPATRTAAPPSADDPPPPASPGDKGAGARAARLPAPLCIFPLAIAENPTTSGRRVLTQQLRLRQPRAPRRGPRRRRSHRPRRRLHGPARR